MTVLTQLTDTLLALTTSPWALLVLLGCCFLDSLIPPVPSEAIVIALAALGMAGQGPHPAVVVLVAAVGAFVGDRTAYAIGSRMPPGRLPLVGADRALRLQTWARRRLDERGATFILSARYIPVGRVAVNITAGMVHFPARRFTTFAALGAVLWATYSMLIGVSVGAALRDQPLVAVAVGVAGGLVVGLAVESVLRRVGNRSGAQGRTAPDAPTASTEHASHPPLDVQSEPRVVCRD